LLRCFFASSPLPSPFRLFCLFVLVHPSQLIKISGLSLSVKCVTAADGRSRVGHWWWKGMQTECATTLSDFWRTGWSFYEIGTDWMRPTSSRGPSDQIKRLHFGQPAGDCLSMVGCGDSRMRRWSKQAQFATCGMPHELDWLGAEDSMKCRNDQNHCFLPAFSWAHDRGKGRQTPRGTSNSIQIWLEFEWNDMAKSRWRVIVSWRPVTILIHIWKVQKDGIHLIWQYLVPCTLLQICIQLKNRGIYYQTDLMTGADSDVFHLSDVTSRIGSDGLTRRTLSAVTVRCWLW
jgi:hypothetical protein